MNYPVFTGVNKYSVTVVKRTEHKMKFYSKVHQFVKKTPTRFVIWMMLFSSSFITFTVKVNMSINLIAMVVPNNDNGTTLEPECKIINSKYDMPNNETHEKLKSVPDYGPRYDWDTKVQALILGAYFWGSIITCIPGAFLAEKFGPTNVIMISTLISGILTMLGPIMASWHYVALIILRFFNGLCGGIIFPSLQSMISKWAPPEERGKFLVAILGSFLGTVVTWSVLGSVIEIVGWSWSFYINGIILILWCILWFLLATDSPDLHPRISYEEKLYITESLGDTITRNKGIPPYKNIFLSVPFWALILLHVSYMWGLSFIITAVPNYFATVLGFSLGNTGILASLPYLAELIFGLIFGTIGDFIRKNQIMSTTTVRKGFILFSHFVPGILFLVLNTIGCDVVWSVAIITISTAFTAAATLTNLQNVQDLAPNFAGTLYGIATTFGNSTGFITPLIIGELTAEHNGLNEWHIVFYIIAAVHIICGLIFCIFGSTEVQPWNEFKNEDKTCSFSVNSNDTSVKREGTMENIY